MKGSWKGIASVGVVVGIGVVAGIVAVKSRSGRESRLAQQGAQAGSAPVVTVYKSPT